MRELVKSNLGKLERFGIHATRSKTPAPEQQSADAAAESQDANAPATPGPKSSRDRSLSGM